MTKDIMTMDQTSYNRLKENIKHAMSSGLLPAAIKKPEQALVIVQKGMELGIPMMQALSHINIVQGKPSMSAELMLSQIYKNVPSAYIHFKVLDNEKCIIECARTSEMPKTTISFSMEDAKRAGLLRNKVWESYPKAMLRSRAVSEMARTLFPDALHGVSYTPEEIGGQPTVDDLQTRDVTEEPTEAEAQDV